MSMRMEQYLTFTDHALWEVIVNGDSVTPVASASADVEGPIPPKTAKQKLAKKSKLKAKSTLMLAIPDEHLLKFHACKDEKFQKLISQLEIHGEVISQEDANLKLLRSLPSAWNNIALIMRNKYDLDTLSMDDLYNNLKVYESKIKGQSMAMLTMRVKRFIKKTGRKLDLNGKETVGFDKTKVECYNYHRRGHFAREYRVPRNQGNRYRDAPRRNAPKDTSTTNALVVQDGIGGYDWSFQVEEGLTNFALMVDTSQGSSSSNSEFLLPTLRTTCPSKADLSFARLDNSVLKSKVSETISSVPKIETNASKTSNDSLEKPKTVRSSASLIEEWESDSEDEKVNTTIENENKAEKPRKFSQSPRGNKRNWNGLMTQRLGDGFKFKKKACFVCLSFNHLIKNCDFYENKMVLNKKGKITGPKEIRPVWDNTTRVNRQSRLTHPYPKRNFVPAAFLTKSGQVPVNAAKQIYNRAAASVSAVRRVNIVASRPNVNDALPTINSYFKAHSPVRRPFNQKSATKTNNFNEKINTARVTNVTTVGPKVVVSTAEGNRDGAVKSSTCWIWRQKGNLIDHVSKDSGSYTLKRFKYVNPQGRLKSDQGIFDSECSRHMTRNKSYLTDYQEIDGGFVAFGGNAKGDKKNSVLFTDTECVVLSPDFKLLDESQVLLKVPRNNKMYSFDLKNVVPLGGLPCLFAKATLDESNLWHRRLGHINFKTMNKLVRGNLGVSHQASQQDPYELFLSRKPALSFMRPFRCPVTILNTLDHLGLKSSEDEVTGKKSTEVQRKKNGVQDLAKEGDKNDQEKDVREQEEALRKQFKQEFERLFGQRKAANTNSTNSFNTVSSPVNAVSSSFTTVDSGRERAQRNELESMFGKDKDTNGNGTYRMFSPVSVVGSYYVNLGGSISVNVATLPNVDLPTNPIMPDLEDNADLQDTGIFSGAYDDEVEGAMVDFNNLEPTTVVSHIPTTMNYKDHPKEQIIKNPLSVPQTRRMTKTSQGYAMVYINKKDDRRIVVKNKARLVAQGHTQEEGIDYDEVFAPVARIEAIRLFLAYASFMGFIVYQMDVKSAFLYGTIEEEVYVCQPPGFEDPQFPNKVYKVEKALYGLHQALRAWYETLSTYLLENMFRIEIIDKTLFIKKDKGLQVMQRDDGIFINQDKYVADILKKFDFSLVKIVSTPIETNNALLRDKEAEDMDVHLYRIMIGSLMYLTAFRLDIIFDVCACARFQVTPKVSHLHVMKRIFRYLKGQPKLGLWYPRDSPFNLEAFSDSDYGGASLDMKSTIGGCQFLGKRLILWQCKKQTVVANSTIKA
nr:hypothetical protein [Tanacetum cinerariifolium]